MAFNFEDVVSRYKIEKEIRLISLFSGYDSQALALKYLGIPFEHYRTCEWAYKSIIALKDIHFNKDNTDYSKELKDEEIIDYLYKKGISSDYKNPMSKESIKRLGSDKYRMIYNDIIAEHNMVNIMQVKGEDLGVEKKDKYEYLMSYSFPCGLAGTKVIMKDGYKNIEDILVGEEVLTHNNRFCKVNKVMTRVSDHYYKIKGLGIPRLYLTGEHPLYVYRDGEFEWIKVKELRKDDMLSFNINNNSINCKYSKEQLWLLGRYVADGWCNKHLYNSIEFAINFDKEEEFLNKIPEEYKLKFKKYKKKGCWEYRIADKDFQEMCKEFGNGAINKHIPQWVIDLPKEKLQVFFEGYISGDWLKRRDTEEIMFSTTSEELFLGLQQIIAKLYNCICTCSIREDNRKASFNDTYNCQFTLSDKHREQKVIDDKIVVKLRKVEKVEEEVQVYNFEVEEDNSYTCQNIIVHNCQALSLAGKQEGMDEGSGTTSSMLWEVGRILRECRDSNSLPQILIMENVPQVHGNKNIVNFNKWINQLKELGYKSWYKDINSKDYGIPQNRNRTFMVSILDTDKEFIFPEEMNLTIKLKDILEKEVEEEYYLTQKQLNYVLDNEDVALKSGRDINDRTVNPEVAKTISCRGAADQRADVTNFVIDGEDKEVVVRNLKEKLCDSLIEDGKVQEYDVIRHSYSNSRMKDWENRNIEKHNEVPTLDTRCDCLGVCVNSIIDKDIDKLKEEVYSEMEKKLFTEDGNIKRYIGSDIVDQFEEGQMATTSFPNGYGHGPRTHNESICLNTIDKPSVKQNLRIRKLTPKECWRLMGVKGEDFNKVKVNQSKSSLYHLAGDSIVSVSLMAIYSSLLGIDYKPYIELLQQDIVEVKDETNQDTDASM